MNVLFLDQFSELGGAQRCLLDLLPAIQERGWHISAGLPGTGPLVDLLRACGAAVQEIPCGPYQSGRKSISDLLRGWRDLRAQVRLLRAKEVDLVYVNGPRVLAAAASAFGGRAPVLFHAHSRVPEGLQARLARRSILRADATVIACCRAVAPAVSQDRLHVIANSAPDMGLRERGFARCRIGIIGRIGPEKGQAEFLRAAAVLQRELPQARFVICGAPIFPAGEYSAEVKRLTDGLPLEFLGWRDDVAPVLAELELLVIASKEEGMPRVMLEAFSAGVPVVAFPVGGIPEVIHDGETGFLVPERTADALAARILEVIRCGPNVLRRVAVNARKEWEQRYTVERYRKNVTDLMTTLVSDWRAKHETAPLR